MLLTLYYMYATFLQWWRLGSLKNKINGTLNAQNALLVCTSTVITDYRKNRSIENLLFRNDNRIGCTIVPKQKVHLSQWVSFPKDLTFFPIHFTGHKQLRIESPNMYILIQAFLETYVKQTCTVLKVENYGELLAWRITENFEMILKTDLDKLTKLLNCFAQHNIDINHDLKLLKIETVDIEGTAARIKYDKRYSLELTQKFSYHPKHWKKFVLDVRQLYAKVRDATNPKITIENGSSKLEETKKVPVSEVKPIKKDSKKVDDKNTLEVTSTDYRRHKSSDRDRKEKHNTTTKSKDKSTSKMKSSDASKIKSDGSKTKSKDGTVREKLSEKHKQKAVIEKEKPSNISTIVLDPIDDSEITVLNEVKPPNVLVFADSLVAKENVKSVLQTMLNRDKYTIYDMPTNPNAPVWNNSTVLVIVCGAVPTNLTSQLLQYFVNGGQLLCLCSDFLYSVLHTFTTAEVREHELVRFTYGQWKQVQMMHHIFCYQASPAKKQFSKDSEHSNPGSGNGSSPVAPRTPSIVDIQHNGKNFTIQVQILGTEETWQTPSLMLATVKGSKGRAIFSQVHLEINPSQYEDDEIKFAALTNSDKARMEILKDILSNHLDVDCSSSAPVQYSVGYLLGRHDLKLKMFSECESIENNKLVSDKITVNFCGKGVNPEPATSSLLPVLIHACPAHFSTVNYFEALETEIIGRLVLYCDVLTSSQDILKKTLANGLVVIPRQQTSGIGRSNNFWISPIGSAMFSLQLHIPLDSNLGKTISIIQHVVMVAIVAAVRKMKGCDDLNIGIKWPNDLYANRNIKIGGLIANTIVNNGIAVINIGVGVNLDNSNPTTCINDLIKEMNFKKKTQIPSISYENYFAQVFNEIEKLVKSIQENNFDGFFDLYYKYWLHSNCHVQVCSPDGDAKKVKISGIDQFGFLKVCTDDGIESTVQPDGNTFDMMRGLIAPKLF